MSQQLQIGGEMCDSLAFVAGEDNALVGVQLYKDNRTVAFLPMQLEQARAALREFELIIERAEGNLKRSM